MNQQESYDLEIKRLTDPFLTMFGAEDGGVAFSRFYHGILPDFYEKAASGDKHALQIIERLAQVSRLIEAVNNGKI